MKHVLVYQKDIDGKPTFEGYDIPRGMEHSVDKYISGEGPFKFKSGLVLTKDEIHGVMSYPEFENFKRVYFAPKVVHGPGHAEWLEFGQALKERKPLDRWKKKNASPAESKSGQPSPTSS